jgi:hypothetical protein
MLSFILSNHASKQFRRHLHAAFYAFNSHPNKRAFTCFVLCSQLTPPDKRAFSCWVLYFQIMPHNNLGSIYMLRFILLTNIARVHLLEHLHVAFSALLITLQMRVGRIYMLRFLTKYSNALCETFTCCVFKLQSRSADLFGGCLHVAFLNSSSIVKRI